MLLRDGTGARSRASSNACKQKGRNSEEPRPFISLSLTAILFLWVVRASFLQFGVGATGAVCPATPELLLAFLLRRLPSRSPVPLAAAAAVALTGSTARASASSPSASSSCCHDYSPWPCCCSVLAGVARPNQDIQRMRTSRNADVNRCQYG